MSDQFPPKKPSVAILSRLSYLQRKLTGLYSLYLISEMLKGAHLPNVYLKGVLVKQVESVKYLGHFRTYEISDDIDIRRQCRVLNVRGNMLFRKFHMCIVRL